MKVVGPVPLCASRFVTTTETLPAAWGGVMTVIRVVPVRATAEAANPPTVTVAPGRSRCR